MNFIMNELSVHGQFHTTADFFNAVETLMAIRNEIRRRGSELYCHRRVANAPVISDVTMPQAIQGMTLEKRRAWIQWLTRHGPFWIDSREHGEDEWLETDGERLVTDTGIGEAAYCMLHDLGRELVSVNPSDWLLDPISVDWKTTDGFQKHIDVRNHWTLDTVSQSLDATPPRLETWQALEEYVRRACDHLTIASRAFEPFDGYPFVPGAADRIQILLDVLNKLRGSFDADGNRTSEFDALYTSYFMSKNACFTDSSESEKREFEKDLTFPHPEKPGEHLFCTWHGKVKTPQIRIHFSWPISEDIPLYVVYVGPKITKR